VILVLDEDVQPGFSGQQRMPHQRRRAHDALDAFTGGIDIGKGRWVHHRQFQQRMGCRRPFQGRRVRGPERPALHQAWFRPARLSAAR
jgi:hypothetical protein